MIYYSLSLVVYWLLVRSICLWLSIPWIFIWILTRSNLILTLTSLRRWLLNINDFFSSSSHAAATANTTKNAQKCDPNYWTNNDVYKIVTHCLCISFNLSFILIPAVAVVINIVKIILSIISPLIKVLLIKKIDELELLKIV